MKWIGILKDTGAAFVADKAMRLSAALAYYSIFSLAPLLIVAISIAGTIFGEKAARGAVKEELTGAIGPDAAATVQEMILGVNSGGKNGIMALVGFGILLLTASGVFAQLKDAMNTVWNIRPKPGRGIVALVWDRLLSLTMVLVIGFLLLVSLLLSAVMTAAMTWLGELLPVHPLILVVVNGSVSLAVVTLLFAMIFKILPDAEIRWQDVWAGAFITACLFGFGKFLLAIYLARQGGSSAYGAAGALILILTWVYYSANILLFGAEFTQVLARYRGRRIQPTAAGEWSDNRPGK
jgi:membrane protein